MHAYHPSPLIFTTPRGGTPLTFENKKEMYGRFPRKTPPPPRKIGGGVVQELRRKHRGAHHPSPSAGVLMNYPKKDLYWII